MSTHMFSVEFATEFWVEKACIIQNLYFWIEKNIKNKKHFYELDWVIRCWTYNSASAFSELLPYISSRSISRHLNELADEWIIFINNFNKIKYDKTLWYSINYDHKAISELLQVKKPILGAICQNGESIGENGEPIPDSNTDTSNSAIATFDVEKFQIKEETPKKKSRSKRSSFIREGSDTIWASYIPPTKLMLEERLWQKRWVDKFYQILILDNMKDTKIFKLDNPDDPLSFTKLISLYEWMIEFFKEKYDWKIYKDSEWRTVGSDIIFNVLDTFIAHYMENKKWEDILNLEARLRTWIINSLKYC